MGSGKEAVMAKLVQHYVKYALSTLSSAMFLGITSS